MVKLEPMESPTVLIQSISHLKSDEAMMIASDKQESSCGSQFNLLQLNYKRALG